MSDLSQKIAAKWLRRQVLAVALPRPPREVLAAFAASGVTDPRAQTVWKAIWESVQGNLYDPKEDLESQPSKFVKGPPKKQGWESTESEVGKYVENADNDEGIVEWTDSLIFDLKPIFRDSADLYDHFTDRGGGAALKKIGIRPEHWWKQVWPQIWKHVFKLIRVNQYEVEFNQYGLDDASEKLFEKYGEAEFSAKQSYDYTVSSGDQENAGWDCSSGEWTINVRFMRGGIVLTGNLSIVGDPHWSEARWEEPKDERTESEKRQDREEEAAEARYDQWKDDGRPDYWD